MYGQVEYFAQLVTLLVHPAMDLELLRLEQDLSQRLTQGALSSLVATFLLPAATQGGEIFSELRQRGKWGKGNMGDMIAFLSTISFDPEIVGRLRAYNNASSLAPSAAPQPAASQLQAQPAAVAQVITDGDRERRLRRLSEAWITHYQTKGRLSDLDMRWNAHITAYGPLPEFGVGRNGAHEALNYFIGRRTTLGSVFALFARFPDLRPDGINKDEATQFADPAVLASLPVA